MNSSNTGSSDRGYSSESLRMLETEEGQLNAVFAYFGSVVQHAQLFEQGLTRFLTMYNRILSDTLAIDDIGDKMTMGQLLGKVRRFVELSDESIEKGFTTALHDRNYLIHRFFLERNSDLELTEGRMKLLYELNQIERNLDKSRVAINAMRIAMCETLGIEDEWAHEYRD